MSDVIHIQAFPRSLPVSAIGSGDATAPPVLREQLDILTEQESHTTTNFRSRAVLVVIASFILTLTACGLNFAFGIYQELYESLDGPFADATPASIDLIGTLGVSLMTIGAPLASAWIKSYSPATITTIGAVFFGLANVLASFSQKLWQFILTQGFLLGCGTCLAYIPAVTVAPGWFKERRGLAMGIVLSGTGIGGATWAPLLRYLNVKIGFRNTLRLTGGLSFVLIALAGLVLRWHPEMERQNCLSRRRGESKLRPPLADWKIVKSRKFLAQAMGAMFQAAAYYAPMYFISTYAITLGYSPAAGANLIALSNVASATGKVILGYIADRFGRLNTLLICTLLSSAATLGLWLPSTIIQTFGKPLFVAYIMIYSVSAGAYISLFPIALVELFGLQHFASVNGLLYMMRGFATLAGTPAAGALIRGRSSDSEVKSSRAFEGTALLIGIMLFGATLGCIWVRIEANPQKRWRWKL